MPMKSRGTGAIDVKINEARLRIHDGVDEELTDSLWHHFWSNPPSAILPGVRSHVLRLGRKG